MTGILGKKLGMTGIFDEQGRHIPCTVVEAGPCYVTQVKSEERDGYEAIQLGFEDKKDKKTTKPLKGHFQKANVTPKRNVAEFKNFEQDFNLGDEVKCDIFEEGQLVDVAGYTKGKGYQGVVKRYGFGGVGDDSHGQHGTQRMPGSVGGASDPSRVFKGKKMGGRTGNRKTKTFDLQIVKVMPEKNTLLIKGSVPGGKGSYITIEQ